MIITMIVTTIYNMNNLVNPTGRIHWILILKNWSFFSH